MNTDSATPTAEAPAAEAPAVEARADEARADEARADAPAATPSEIVALREEIDALDVQILHLIMRRTEVSRRIGAIRRAEGGPKIVLSREQAVLARFRDLGPEGRELGMMLLRLGRGRLGR